MGSAEVSRGSLLAAFADTLVPSIETENADPETAAFLRRSATDVLAPETLAGIAGPRHEPLLAELESAGFAELDLERRTKILVELGARGGEPRQLLRELKGAMMGLFYALPDAEGRNPNWPALGYPGPLDRAAAPGAGTEDDPGRAALGGAGHLDGRRLHRRLGSRRLGDRRRAAARRPERRRARAWRLPQRGRLPAARARRRAGAVPPRRAVLLRHGLDGPARRCDARRRDGDQLDGLPAPARPDQGRVGGDGTRPGSTRPSSTTTSTRFRGGST